MNNQTFGQIGTMELMSQDGGSSKRIAKMGSEMDGPGERDSSDERLQEKINRSLKKTSDKNVNIAELTIPETSNVTPRIDSSMIAINEQTNF